MDCWELTISTQRQKVHIVSFRFYRFPKGLWQNVLKALSVVDLQELSLLCHQFRYTIKHSPAPNMLFLHEEELSYHEIQMKMLRSLPVAHRSLPKSWSRLVISHLSNTQAAGVSYLLSRADARDLYLHVAQHSRVKKIRVHHQAVKKWEAIRCTFKGRKNIHIVPVSLFMKLITLCVSYTPYHLQVSMNPLLLNVIENEVLGSDIYPPLSHASTDTEPMPSII